MLLWHRLSGGSPVFRDRLKIIVNIGAIYLEPSTTKLQQRKWQNK